jgi:nucleoside 2-deoxyribosyltransferase
MFDVYLAGPFFNEQEISMNHQAKAILRERGFNVFVPQEHFVPDGENMPNDEWGKAVFEMDRDAIQNSKHVVAIYHGMYSDSGTAWELGYAYALNKKILIVCVDIVKTSLMIINGCTAVVDGIDSLQTFDFDKFPMTKIVIEQK